jgi:sec-independent protein translocase protein TatB
MFDFDPGKLIIIGIVALIVIGPKELPGVLRQVGRLVSKMRRMAAEFQGQFMEAIREADIADIKSDVTKLAESAKLDMAFNPVADLKDQITGAIKGAGQAAAASAGANDAALKSGDLPVLPEAPNHGIPLLTEVEQSSAAAEFDSETSCPSGSQPPGPGIEAEMRALANALEAEMRSAKPGELIGNCSKD